MAPATHAFAVRRSFLALAASLALASCTHGIRTDGGETAAAVQQLLSARDTLRAVERLEHSHLEEQSDAALYTALGSLYRARGTIDGRLRSQRTLERALQRFPDDAAVLMELGRTYYAQTFYPDAERCFRSALALDPSLCDAHYFLGITYYDRWKRVHEYTDDLDTARAEFARTIACAPENTDAARRYAFALYALGLPDSAASACDTMIERFPDRPEFYLLRGAVAYDHRRYDDAAADFDAGLARLDTTSRAAYDDVLSFIPMEERDAYALSAPENRAAVGRAFWIDADPDPTTARNERALEHVYRTFLADVFFSCVHPPRRGWETERGQTLIKFGWPDSLETTLGGSWKDGRLERWRYDIDDEIVDFVFVDEYLNGNLRIPYRADALVGVLRYAPRVSAFDDGTEAVPGDMDVVAFKDTDMSAALCIALSVNADSLAYMSRMDRTDHFHLRGVLFDDDWRSESRFADTLWTSEMPVSAGDPPTYDLVREVSVPFDHYHVACSLGDAGGAAAARLRADGDTYRFAGDRLTVSDVLLESARDGGAGWVRGGRTLHPNAARRYRAGEPLRVYFEVYNLRVSAGRSDYSVSYLIYESPQSPPPAWRRWGGRLAALVGADRDPSISQTFDRAGTSHRESEEVTINIDTLPEGRYTLVVSVEDHASGEGAESQATFTRGAAD